MLLFLGLKPYYSKNLLSNKQMYQEISCIFVKRKKINLIVHPKNKYIYKYNDWIFELPDTFNFIETNPDFGGNTFWKAMTTKPITIILLS